MRFSKEKFLKNAPMEIRRRLKGDLDVLDGMKVMFDREHGTSGLIPLYFSNVQEYCLYPVEEEWCEEILGEDKKKKDVRDYRTMLQRHCGNRIYGKPCGCAG